MNIETSIYKTTAHKPLNEEYYELNETVDYIIEIKNTGDTVLEDVKVYDSLYGLDPIAEIASLAPGGEQKVPFSHIADQDDMDRKYIVNQAEITYTFLGGKPGTPQKSNEVYVKTGEPGPIPPFVPGGETDLNTDKLGTPVFITEGGAESCSLTLTALGANEIHYTLHACAAHTEAAKKAENAGAAEAVAIWKAEIDKLYQELFDTAGVEAQAMVQNDRMVFWAYADAFGAVYGDEALAGLLRLRCAELCCMKNTAPDALPDSILGEYAQMMTGGQYDTAKRTFSALKGSDCEVTVTLNKALANTLDQALSTVKGVKRYAADKAFVQTQAQWQMALDNAVNAMYKAADKEARKAIVAWRKLLDQVVEARKDLLSALYPENPETVQEALANLYRDAAIEAN